MRNWWVWPLVAAVWAVGCGEGTGPTPAGTFEAAVSGAVSLELSGTAEFGIFPGEGFGMVLLPAATAAWLGIGHSAEARPQPGTYPMGNPDAGNVYFAHLLSQSGQGAASFISYAGELVITSSSSAMVEGTFAFPAVGTAAGSLEELEVWVEGSFRASCASGARCE